MKPPDSSPDRSARLWLLAALVAVPKHCCHFPLGSTADEAGFRFCCAPCGEPPQHAGLFPPRAAVPPYCPKHYRLAYLYPEETQEQREREERRAAKRAVYQDTFS